VSSSRRDEPLAVHTLVLQRQEARWNAVSVMQLAPGYEHDMYMDEVPTLATYHPPPSGGMASVHKMAHDRAKWRTHRWVHTSATALHEHLPVVRFCLAALFCIIEFLQLSYFPLRAAFPPVMAPWLSLSQGLVTFNISSMEGTKAFWPAFLTAIILALVTVVIATFQVRQRV
jgi:hypothetical protein